MNDSFDPILQQEEQRKLRVQLMWRLAIAAALVCGVLGALAWLDQEKDQKPQVTVSAPKDVRIAPSTASTIASQPVPASQPEASSPTSAPQIASFAASTPAITALSASTAQTTPTAQRASSPAPQTSTPVKPAEIAAAQQQTTLQPVAKPTTAPITAPAKPTPPMQPAAPAQPMAPIKPSTPTKLVETNKPALPAQHEPSLPPATAKPAQQAAAAPAARYPAPVATPNGYTVQAGVFLHSANAENMLKQVQNAGIPAYLETRVQIGPFSNRTEAEIAVQKLRKLGLEPVVKSN